MVVMAAAHPLHPFPGLFWSRNLRHRPGWSLSGRCPSWFVHSPFGTFGARNRRLTNVRRGLVGWAMGIHLESPGPEMGDWKSFPKEDGGCVCGSRRPSGDLSRSFLSPPHIRLVALPYQGESQEVIAVIIGWGHWVKRRRTFGDTGSRAKWNQKCYCMKSNVFLYFEKLTFSMENYTLTFRLARLKYLVVHNRSNTKGSSE